MSSASRGRGRPRAGTDSEDDSILRAWHAVQVSGVSRREFATQHSMSSDELERIIQRASKRLVKGPNQREDASGNNPPSSRSIAFLTSR